MKEKLKIVIGVLLIIALIALAGLLIYNTVKSSTEEVVHPVATFDILEHGTVKVELYPEYAPNTVSNFIALINSGFYNNKSVYGKDEIALYMARDTSEDAKGPTVSLIDSSIEEGSDADYEYEINGEFIANKFEQNTLRHEKGVISLNRSDYSYYGLIEEGYNSGSYRFSIIMNSEDNLNGVYCAFGKVIEGLDILQEIYDNQPLEKSEEEEDDDSSSMKEFENKPVIGSASVDTYGVSYEKPEVHEAFDINGYINELYSSYYSN